MGGTPEKEGGGNTMAPTEGAKVILEKELLQVPRPQ